MICVVDTLSACLDFLKFFCKNSRIFLQHHGFEGNSEKDEGTACRIHGNVRVKKVKGDSVVVTVGKGIGIDGLFAHFGSDGNCKFFFNRS